MSDPQSRWTFPNRLEAEMAQGMLESAGLHSWLVTDDTGGANPLQLSGGAHVVVDEADGAAAAELLERPPDG